MTPHLVRERQRILSHEEEEAFGVIARAEVERRLRAIRHARRWRIVLTVLWIVIGAGAIAAAIWWRLR